MLSKHKSTPNRGRALKEVYGFRMGYGAAIAVILFLIMLCFIAYFLWSMYREERGR